MIFKTFFYYLYYILQESNFIKKLIYLIFFVDNNIYDLVIMILIWTKTKKNTNFINN